MKKCYWIVLFGFLSMNLHLHSQKKNIVSDAAYSEKIYVQLTSTVFTTGDVIWFKAIVTDVTHVPTKLSSVLHVEVVDFDKRIITKKLFKLENGIANGFLDLNEQLPTGRYQLRAYTEWNRNFGKDFISETYIDVYSLKKSLNKEEAIQNMVLMEKSPGEFELSAKVYPKILNSKYRGKLKVYVHTLGETDSIVVKKGENDAYNFNYRLPKDAVNARVELKLDSVNLRSHGKGFVSSFSKTIAVNKEYIDLQFFPEGGKLVVGLTSKVAFKALDYKNEGANVTGHIVDGQGVIVMPFKCGELGMGVTYLTPVSGKKYYAIIKGKMGIVYKYKLPVVNDEGVVLAVKERRSNIILALKTNLDCNNLSISVTSRGVEKDSFSVDLKNGGVVVGLDKTVFPEGLLKFRVADNEGKVVCERLFFNYREEDRVEIATSTTLKQYNQRGKTIIKLNTKDKDSNAVKTNLSVLVLSKKQFIAADVSSNHILSYFLLNSELKGRVEEPDSYFNKSNSRRKHDMDALVLTQGWSNYKYENTEPITDFKFFPEKGLIVKGRLRNLIMSKRELRKPINLTMIYGPLNVVTQQVDSSGSFYFQLEDYYKDNFKVLIQSKTKKGKKKDFTVDLALYQSPAVSYRKETHVTSSKITNVYLKQSVLREQAERDFRKVNGTVDLDEVQIAGYKMTPAREKMMDLHGRPNIVIEDKELLNKKENWHSGLYSLLQSCYPDDIEIYRIPPPPVFLTKNKFLEEIGLKENDVVARDYDTDFTFIVIDGVPVTIRDYVNLDVIQIEGIKSVELIKKPKLSRFYESKVFRNASLTEEGITEVSRLPAGARVSIISIYTFSGKGFNGLQRPKGMFKGVVPGFATKREFYVPKYDDSFNDWSVPDLRPVVFWVTEISTDDEGNAQVEFYNGDDTGEMLIQVEGVTKEGGIGRAEAIYSVVEKLE